MESMQRKVQCWIYSRTPDGAERCLLLKTIPARGGYWQPVTGTVENHEGYFEAACREPIEETGFRFQSAPIDTGYEFEFHSHHGPAHERTFALVVEDMPRPSLDPKEHQDFLWESPQNALALLRFGSNIEGLKRTYRLIFGKDFPRGGLNE